MLLLVCDFYFKNLCRLVLYAIAMTDYEQDNGDSCKRVVSTREGIETISIYTSSIGRLDKILHLPVSFYF
jgi:hypothetical protein